MNEVSKNDSYKIANMGVSLLKTGKLSFLKN